MSESKSNLYAQLEAIKAFVASPAHGSYLATIKVEIEGAEASILAVPPVTDEDRGCSLIHFGRREELLKALNFFVESQAVLEDRIAELDEPDTNVPDNKET